MQIKSQFKNRSGEMVDYVFTEGKDPNEDLEGKILQAVHGFCFYGDKLVIVYANDKGYWTFPGGGIEPGETWQEATIREVKEESNMKVLHMELIGYIDVYEKDRVLRQPRAMCIVKPYGEFVSDPDADITEIKLVDPKDHVEFVKWGEIGDHIVKRAVEMKEYNFEDMTRETVVDPIELAKRFASKKFAEIQTGNHFLEVYEILKNEFAVNDIDILVAGLLHDTLEDTSATFEQIERIFGKKAAILVDEVSHPKNYNEQQKKEYYEKIKHISDGGKIIKLADFRSHLPKFIGAFTGENNLPKFTHTEYTDYILSFLESCPDSSAKSTVYNLTKRFEGYILGK